MAYDPNQHGENKALIVILTDTIDRYFAAQSELARLLEVASGQGIAAGLSSKAGQRLPGVNVDADQTLAAAQALASIAGVVKSSDDGGQVPQTALDALEAFRNDFAVQAIIPIRCRCG